MPDPIKINRLHSVWPGDVREIQRMMMDKPGGWLQVTICARALGKPCRGRKPGINREEIGRDKQESPSFGSSTQRLQRAGYFRAVWPADVSLGAFVLG